MKIDPMSSVHAIRSSVLFGLGLAAACQGAGAREERPREAPPVGDGAARSRAAEAVAAPMDVAGTIESRFEYLVAKYDADGDGAVAIDEYDRESGRFARFDRDADGVLTAADFESGGAGMDAEVLRGFGQEMAFLRAFQSAEEPERLTGETLEASLRAADMDVDGALDAAELGALFERETAPEDGLGARMWSMMMRDADPVELVTSAVDQDGDGVLQTPEVFAYFEEQAGDDGAMTGGLGGGSRRGAGSARPAAGGRGSRAAEGEVAPDFELEPPGGGEAVTLSSFRGARPVALIFGSYT